MRRIIRFASVVFLCMFLLPMFSVFAGNNPNDYKHLDFATLDFRPLSNDKLLYTAFKEIGYDASFTVTVMELGNTMANDGSIDGVVSATPGLEKTHENLIKVPVPLEAVDLVAFVRDDGDIKVSKLDDLNGLTVGILSYRPHLAEMLPTGASIVERDTNENLNNSLLNGELDVIVQSRRSHEVLKPVKGTREAFLVGGMTDYLYLNKRNGYLVATITRTLNKMFADGRADDILDYKYVPEEKQKKTLLHIVGANTQLSREEQFAARVKEQYANDPAYEWYTLELYSRRYARDPDRLSSFANILRQDCLARNVVAIIVSGDDALSFLKNWYYLYFRDIPVLFYGVNEKYETIIEGYEEYFTGLEEQISAYDTIDEALNLFPGTKNIFVVNDYNTEGSYYKQEIREQLRQLTGSVSIEYNEDLDYDVLFEKIKTLSDDTIVLVGSYFTDSNRQYYNNQELMRRMETDCPVPVFTVYSTRLEYNAVGGKALDYNIVGNIIGDMLRQVLDGVPVYDIPVVLDPEIYNRWVFDKVQLDKWGIKKSWLPEDSEILNLPETIWDTDPRFATTLVILLVLSILAAVFISYYTVKYRRQKELVLKDAKIKEVKERLEQIINSAPVAMAITVGDYAIETNEYMKQSIGLHPGDDIRPVYTDIKQRDMLREESAAQGVISNRTIGMRMQDGSSHRFWANVSSLEYEGQRGFILWAMDIEENEKHSDMLRTARQNLQEIIDNLPVAVGIMKNDDMSILYANNSALKLFSFDSLEEIKGQPVVKIAPERQSNGVESCAVFEEILNANEPLSKEIEYLDSTGKLLDTLNTSCVIDFYGIPSTLCIITDLAAEKQQKEMLMNAARKEKEANQLKSRFLVNMSHEIRTPMNAIIGLTEIELSKESGNKDIYRKINISAKSLLEIINDILDLSKVEADKIELYSDEFDLEDVLNCALMVATPRLDGKHVEFMLNAALDLPRYLVGDKTRLWQILKNFLDNSAKFTDYGKIVLSAYVDKERSDDEIAAITFVVEDTGIGISEAQMEKLFLPYEQVHNDAQKRYSGTGLGLAISKQLCEIMGGNLEVHSTVGQGTTVVINIPFKRSKNDETEIQAIAVPELDGLEILAVDDDQMSLDIMFRILSGNKVKCTTAKSGMEAMEIILDYRDKGKSFDVILLDYMMDGLNGIETARQIHLALSKAPKLLMVTAYQKLILAQELEKNGIDDVIEKPFIPSQFIHKLCVAMGFETEDEGSERAFTMFKDVNILLCEDYRINQEVAAGMLAQFGIVADIAENGKMGVQMLNTGKEYDLVLMDLQMPVMDGYEATTIIRSDPRFDKLPIVSLTADAMKEVVDKCLEIGMNDHIAKPIEFSSLHRVFLKWLPESKRVAQEKQKKVVSGVVSNEVLARFGGKKELYQKVLVMFTELLPEKWVDYDDAIANLDETKSFVHKLKGAAGNIAENDIYKCAVDFEASVRAGAPDRDLYELLVDECMKSRTRILENVRIQKSVPKEK